MVMMDSITMEESRFDKGLNPVVFKCHWFDPRRVRQDPEIGLVEVERSSIYKGEDVYILAT
jgi:hypothetical protein